MAWGSKLASNAQNSIGNYLKSPINQTTLGSLAIAGAVSGGAAGYANSPEHRITGTLGGALAGSGFLAGAYQWPKMISQAGAIGGAAVGFGVGINSLMGYAAW